MNAQRRLVHQLVLVFSGAVIFLSFLPGNSAGGVLWAREAAGTRPDLRTLPLHDAKCVAAAFRLRGGAPKKKPKAAAAKSVKKQAAGDAMDVADQSMLANDSNKGGGNHEKPRIDTCPDTQNLDKDETDSLYSSDLPLQNHDVGKTDESWLTRSQVPYGFYNILGLDRSAGAKEIRQAYRKLAILAHPDRNQHNVEEATAKFQILQKAYEVLSDPSKKSLYDISGLLEEDTTEFGMGMGDMAFNDVVEYFRQLERVVSQEDIVSFEEEYRGNPPEKSDLISFYHRFKGDLADVIAYIPYAEDDDMMRFRAILTREVQEKNLRPYEAFNAWKLDDQTLKNTPELMVPKKRITTQENNASFEALRAKIQDNRSKRAQDIVDKLQKYAPNAAKSQPSLEAARGSIDNAISDRPKRQAALHRPQQHAPVVRAVAQKSTARPQKAPKLKSEAAGKPAGKRGRPPSTKPAEVANAAAKKPAKKIGAKSKTKAASAKKDEGVMKGVEKIKKAGKAGEKAKEAPAKEKTSKDNKTSKASSAVKKVGTKKTVEATSKAKVAGKKEAAAKTKKASKETGKKSKTDENVDVKPEKKKQGRPPKAGAKTSAKATNKSQPKEKKAAAAVAAPSGQAAKQNPPARKAASAAAGKKSEIVTAGSAAMRAKVDKDRVVAKAASAARRQLGKKVIPVGGSAKISGVKKHSRNPLKKKLVKRAAQGRRAPGAKPSA